MLRNNNFQTQNINPKTAHFTYTTDAQNKFVTNTALWTGRQSGTLFMILNLRVIFFYTTSTVFIITDYFEYLYIFNIEFSSMTITAWSYGACICIV